MNEIRTYNSNEGHNNSYNKNSIKVQCPKCKVIGNTVVEEKNDWFCTIMALIFCFPLFFIIVCLCKSPMKKYVHYCQNCGHDCSDVEPYDDSICILF